MNPDFLADNARADSASAVYELMMLGGIEEQLIGLTAKIAEVESDIKASSDPDERKQLREEKEQLRKKKEQLRKEKEQLREIELVHLRRQDGPSK